MSDAAPMPERRLAAVLFSDVVGYSARMQKDEAGTMALVAADFALMNEECARHGGEVLNSMGDGLLMCFPSAVQAVSCALAMQSQFGQRRASTPPEQALEHRIGIHVGDVLRQIGGGIAGDGVNIAARLEGKAPAGGICISQIVHDTVKGKIAMQAVFIGSETLKNITDPVPIWHVAPEGAPTLAKPRAPRRRWVPAAAMAGVIVAAVSWWWFGFGHRAAPPADDKSVAVLAFTDLSEKRDSEYFSDGISDELLNVLAKVPGLRVTARTSSFYFKGKNLPISEIALKLNVAYLLEGSVQRVGDTVRISAQLVKAADGYQVWAQHFDREVTNIFALQDEIAGLIAKKLSLSLADQASAEKPVNPAAFTRYLEARQAAANLSITGMARSEALYLEALRIDPGFSRASAGLVLLRTTRALTRSIPSRFHEQELADLERDANDVIRIDPTLSEAHAALATIYAMTGHGPEAGAEFARANQLGFDREQATLMSAFSQMDRGRPDLAIATGEAARAVNPLAWMPYDFIGLGSLFSHHYQEAAAALQTGTGFGAPPVLYANQALALTSLGRNSDAIESAHAALNIPNRADWSPGLLAWTDGLAAWALARSGARQEAEAIVQRLLSGPEESRYKAGYALAVLGKVEQAAALLVDQQSTKGYLYFLIDQDPALRNDPHFTQLLKTLGATDAFATYQEIVAGRTPKD
jgi:adenylate cyclase